MAMEPRLDRWLGVLAERNGSDILLTAGSAPLLRVDGRLLGLPDVEPLSADDIHSILRHQLDDPEGQRLSAEHEIDFSFSWRDRARIRGNAFWQRGTCSVSLRRIPMDIPTPEEIGLPAVIAGLLRSPSGLILVTGPTGAGKSTTQAAMLDAVNRSRPCHIVTIEDPIEYLHDNHTAAISQREIGTDTDTFADALRAVLRQDPDVVLVGEMRDPESISTTLTIAETGHLVLATLHTNDSPQAIDRIIDVFPAERRPQIQLQLSATLLAVIYQRLLPRAGGGMVSAYEVMVGTTPVRNLIREGKTRQLRNVLSTSQADGMQTLESHLNALVRDGTVEHQAALDASLYPQEIAKPPAPPVMAPVTPVAVPGAA